MFEDDDDFDLCEEDFLKVAENLENAAVASNNAPSKRRSFELGCSSSPNAKRARVPESQSSESTLSPLISYMGGQKKPEPMQDTKPYNPSDPLGLSNIYGLKTNPQKDRTERKNFSACNTERTEVDTNKPSSVNTPQSKKIFQFKSPQNPGAKFQTSNKTAETSPSVLSDNISKQFKDAYGSNEIAKTPIKTAAVSLDENEASSSMKSTNIFSQSTLDSELDLSLDDLSPWKPGKTVVQKFPVSNSMDIPNMKTGLEVVTAENHECESSKPLKNIPQSIQNILSNRQKPVSEPLNTRNLASTSVDRTVNSKDLAKTSQPDTLSLPSSLESSLSSDMGRKTAQFPREDDRQLSPIPNSDFTRFSIEVNTPLSESPLPGQSTSKFASRWGQNLVKTREDTPRPRENPVANDIVLRTFERNLRTKSDTAHSGDSVKSRDDNMRLGDNTLKSRDNVTRDKTFESLDNVESASSNLRTNNTALQTPKFASRPALGFKNKQVDAGLNKTNTSDSGGSGDRPSGNKRKRKFPGPAGVLPKLKHGLDSVRTLKPESPVVVAPPAEDTMLSSQAEDRFHDNDLWRTMTRELEPQAGEILCQFSIRKVLAKAMKKQLPRGKVPVLACVLDQLHLHSNTQDASVTLKDPSGEIQGTLHRQLLKDYPVQMISGSVLLLRQVAVFSPTTRNHYLNITPNNIVRVYSRDLDEGVSNLTIGKFITDDFTLPDPSLFVAPQTPSPRPPCGHMLNQNLFQNRYGSPNSAPSMGQFKAPAVRPRHQGQGQSPRFGNSPNVGASPRFGNSPHVGASPRIGSSPNVGASPRFGNSPRIPSNSPRFNTNSNAQTISSSGVPLASTKSKPPPPWLKKSDQVNSNTSTLDQESVDRTVASTLGSNAVSVSSPKTKPPWLQTAQNKHQGDSNSGPCDQNTKDNQTSNILNSNTPNSTSPQSMQSTSTSVSTHANNSNTRNTETQNTVLRTPVSQSSKFAFKRPAFKPPPPKVKDGATGGSKDVNSMAKPSDVSDLLDGVVDDLLDDF